MKLPVIPINGIMIGWGLWTPVAKHAQLKHGRPFLRYSPPGFDGRARMAGETPSPSEWAADMVRTLDSAGVEKAHLLAHCSGCNVAVTAAAEYPDRFQSVLLIAFWHRTKEWESRKEINRVGVRAYAEARADKLVSPTCSKERKQMLVNWIVEATTDTEAFLQLARMLCLYNSKPDFERMTQPTMAIVGMDDSITSAEAQISVALKKGAMVCAMPTIGHCPHLEAPEEVATLGEALWGKAEACN